MGAPNVYQCEIVMGVEITFYSCARLGGLIYRTSNLMEKKKTPTNVSSVLQFGVFLFLFSVFKTCFRFFFFEKNPIFRIYRKDVSKFLNDFRSEY